MAKLADGLDSEKLLGELIRVLHEEEYIGTAQVIEIFEKAGGDEEQAMELLDETTESDEFGFEGADDNYDEDDEDDE